MKRTLTLLAVLLLAPLAALPAADAPIKPNILLIYSDDHGWADLGAQGVDKDIRTPNLDQLARDGVLSHAATSPRRNACRRARA